MKWCQERIGLYKGIEIKNFSSSWNDGLAFCALIHSFLPSRIDYEQLRLDANPKKNFQVAFKIAQSLGIQQTLDIQDLLNQERPDWNAVMNYVTLIYKHFHHMQSKDSQSSSSSSSSSQSSTDEDTGSITRPTNMKCSRSASSSPNDGLRQPNSQSALIKSTNSIITLPLSLTIASSGSGGNSAESSSAFNSASSSSSSISKTVC